MLCCPLPCRTLCVSCPVVHYAYALLNDCFLDSRCLAAMAHPLALAGACLHLGLLVTSSTPCASVTATPPVTLYASVSASVSAACTPTNSDAARARVCLKPPDHPLHAALTRSLSLGATAVGEGGGGGGWWHIFFGITDEEFWRTVSFVVQANQERV